MQRIIVFYGTRPEAIKMAPVIAALRRRPNRVDLLVCTTAQHRELIDQAEEVLDLRPDLDLDLMRPEQTLNGLAANALEAIDRVVAERAPDWVLAQGDTTTAMAAALASFHRRIKLGHVEAGLRTGDLAEPFPEEANRRVIDLVASALFAPTERAKQALLREGVPPERVYLTGNTAVDALHAAAARLPPESPAGDEVLVTLHRRESFGEPLDEVLGALRELAETHPTVRWVYPVHPNPAVARPAHEHLGALSNVKLVAPLDHLSFVARLRACRFVISDSGGIQEEAPTFGKRVLVVRRVTERPEGVEAGFSLLVGTDRRRIVEEATRLLAEPESAQPIAANPYGDGLAGERIAAILTGESWEPWTPPLTHAVQAKTARVARATDSGRS